MGDGNDLSLKLKEVSLKRNSLKLKASKTDAKVARANRIANDLARKFGNDSHLPFFRKCAWHLSENQIWSIYERSKSLWYFIAAAKSEMNHGK